MAPARALRKSFSRRNPRRRSCARLAQFASARFGAPARSGSAHVFHRAYWLGAPDRLRSGRGPGPFRACAGIVRARSPSLARGRPRTADPRIAFPRAAPDPDHEDPARLLEGLLGRGKTRDARPLSQAPLARRSGGGTPDAARKTARKVIFHHTAKGSGEIYRLLPSRPYAPAPCSRALSILPESSSWPGFSPPD